MFLDELAAWIWEKVKNITYLILYRFPLTFFSTMVKTIISTLALFVMFPSELATHIGKKVWKAKNDATRIWEKVWNKVKDDAFYIFYQKPMRAHHNGRLKFTHLARFYKYLSILFEMYYVIPWIGIAACAGIVMSCESYAMRPYLEPICVRPSSNPGTQTPWYLDSWEARPVNQSNSLSPALKIILISHLTVWDAQLALIQDVSKLNDMPPNIMAVDELSASLCKS